VENSTEWEKEGSKDVLISVDVRIEALRDIKAGEEIYIDYGTDFWEEPKKDTKKKKEKKSPKPAGFIYSISTYLKIQSQKISLKSRRIPK
jgi:hypothetical protein